MQGYYLLTFENTHGAIKAEAALKEYEIKTNVMPTPTSITKSCGISLKIAEEDLEDVKTLIRNGKLSIKAMFFKDNSGFKSIEI